MKAAKRLDLTPSGHVRGWHACPKGRLEPGVLGTYDLILDNEGHVCCASCGAHDLVKVPR
jgi:hypothetical protein